MSQSLADQAIEALAAVARMDAATSNEHPERHTIRALKRHAEEIIGNALRTAHALAWLAEDIRRQAREAEDAMAGEGTQK